MRWHVRSAEQTIIQAGKKMPILTMPWIYRTRTSTMMSSSSRSSDPPPNQARSRQSGGLRPFSLSSRLSRSISMQLTDYAFSHNRPNLDTNGYQLRGLHSQGLKPWHDGFGW